MASTLSLVARLSRLVISSNVHIPRPPQIHTQASPLLLQVTDKLYAEPMKRKKKVDPNILAARTQKKLKRIDKEIKRLNRFGRILKPVEEIEMDHKKWKAMSERKRDPAVLSFEESESRAFLHKQWSRHRKTRYYDIVHEVKRTQTAREEALQELRDESEELYTAAIQKDPYLLPLQFDGPKETPPIKDYAVPDGEYVDTSRKY